MHWKKGNLQMTLLAIKNTIKKHKPQSMPPNARNLSGLGVIIGEIACLN
jgi:hypothetical protein